MTPDAHAPGQPDLPPEREEFVRDEQDAEEAIVELLRDAGVPESARLELAEQIHEINYRLGVLYACGALVNIAQWLEGTPEGVALRRTLAGPGGKSLRQAAKDAGVSAPAMLKRMRKL